MTFSLKKTTRVLAFTGAALAAGNAAADGFNDLEWTVRSCDEAVVVVDIPFCTDECGQVLRDQRTAAVRTAFEKADANNDGRTFAFVAASASRVAPTAYNQELSERRLSYAVREATQAGAQVLQTAAYGETRARGTEVANYPADRYARIYLTDDPSDMIVTQEGMRPAAGVQVIGYRAPVCNS